MRWKMFYILIVVHFIIVNYTFSKDDLKQKITFQLLLHFLVIHDAKHLKIII